MHYVYQNTLYFGCSEKILSRRKSSYLSIPVKKWDSGAPRLHCCSGMVRYWDFLFSYTKGRKWSEWDAVLIFVFLNKKKNIPDKNFWSVLDKKHSFEKYQISGIPSKRYFIPLIVNITEMKCIFPKK